MLIEASTYLPFWIREWSDSSWNAGFGKVCVWTWYSDHGGYHSGLHRNVSATWSRLGNADHGEGKWLLTQKCPTLRRSCPSAIVVLRAFLLAQGHIRHYHLSIWVTEQIPSTLCGGAGLSRIAKTGSGWERGRSSCDRRCAGAVQLSLRSAAHERARRVGNQIRLSDPGYPAAAGQGFTKHVHIRSIAIAGSFMVTTTARSRHSTEMALPSNLRY